MESTKSKPKIKITINAPVTLAFVTACLGATILNTITMGLANRFFFSVFGSSLLNPLTYIRLFTHVIGHADFEHFFGNMTYILLLGPLIEEKYGPKNFFKIILITAFVTGIISFIFFPNIMLCGASGVCFALILLSSMTGFKNGEIPITLIIVAIVYIGQQIIQGIFVVDNVSNLSHIIGGIVGTVLGFKLAKDKAL